MQKPFWSALLSGSRAYLDPDGRVILRLASDFMLAQLKRENADAVIREALSAELGKSLRESEVVLEVKPQESSRPDETIFDEIEKYSN